MDLRKKIKVSPYHYNNIPLGDPYEIDDKDGNPKTEYSDVDHATLSEILEEIRKAGINESDYDKVHVQIGYERRSDPAIIVFYKKPKTQEEIDKETELMRKEYEKKQKEKEKSHQEKMKKKSEKQKIIASLTPEQRKALGYDDDSLS